MTVVLWQKCLEICMGRTHRKQVVSRNRSICLIVGDVVCLCAVTATYRDKGNKLQETEGVCNARQRCGRNNAVPLYQICPDTN